MNGHPEGGSTLAGISRVEVEAGDSLADVEWKVVELARAQVASLRDLVQPGTSLTVDVGAFLPEKPRKAAM